MTIQAFYDVTIAAQEKDLSGTSNKVLLKASAEELDRTTFRNPVTLAPNTVKQVGGGLLDWELECEGFVAYGVGSDFMNASSTAASCVATVAIDPADGSDAFVAVGTIFDIETTGEAGQDQMWSANIKNRDRLGMRRGTVLHPPYVERTTGGSGTGRQLGAVVAGKALYCNVHVFALDGTLEVEVQSAPTAGFSSPTTRVSFDATTDRVAYHESAAGPITDTYWRVVYTLTGTARFLAAAAIK